MSARINDSQEKQQRELSEMRVGFLNQADLQFLQRSTSRLPKRSFRSTLPMRAYLPSTSRVPRYGVSSGSKRFSNHCKSAKLVPRRKYFITTPRLSMSHHQCAMVTRTLSANGCNALKASSLTSAPTKSSTPTTAMSPSKATTAKPKLQLSASSGKRINFTLTSPDTPPTQNLPTKTPLSHPSNPPSQPATAAFSSPPGSTSSSSSPSSKQPTSKTNL